MDFDTLMVPTVSKGHSETLEVLSNSWCNFAIQALQPKPYNRSISVGNDSTEIFEGDALSWIWIQQAMHSERNYSTGFQKKWWKRPVSNVSIRKWVKEMKEKKKEGKRLQRAEVHAAVSIAGLAAALAAIAEENSRGKLELEYEQSSTRKTALASAAAMVASQCAQMAEFMGASRGQLKTVISSTLCGTSTSDILTLTTAALTSLRGAATLKARAGCKNRALKGAPVLPVEIDNSKLDEDLDFQRRASILAKGAILTIRTADGRSIVRLVSLHLNNEAKVVMRIMKRILNVITSKKECVVLKVHAELNKDSGGGEYNKCYQIGFTTSRGTNKLDMAGDYQCYKMWATTINQMLMLSPSHTKYELQFCKC